MVARTRLRWNVASDIDILRYGTVAPVGNLRIEEAVPATKEPPQRFPRQAVIDREHAFIEYAANAGAQVGGATGAGGDSPNRSRLPTPPERSTGREAPSP